MIDHPPHIDSASTTTSRTGSIHKVICTGRHITKTKSAVARIA